MLSMDMMFVVDSYIPMGRHGGGGSGSGSLYTWELLFWGYILCVHSVLLVTLASPVDVFDTTVVVSFTVLCMAFLCKPRQEGEGGGGGGGGGGATQAIVLCVLVLSAWLALTSIPHAYEVSRISLSLSPTLSLCV